MSSPSSAVSAAPRMGCFNLTCPKAKENRQHDLEVVNRVRLCTRCSFAAYCNQECQSADWKRHKPECAEKMKPIVNRELEKLLEEHKKADSEMDEKTQDFVPTLSSIAEFLSSRGAPEELRIKGTQLIGEVTKKIEILRKGKDAMQRENEKFQKLLPDVKFAMKVSSTAAWATEKCALLVANIFSNQQAIQFCNGAINELNFNINLLQIKILNLS